MSGRFKYDPDVGEYVEDANGTFVYDSDVGGYVESADKPAPAKKPKKLPKELPVSLVRRRLPERNAVIDTEMPSGLPSKYSLDGNPYMAGVRSRLMTGLASNDPAVKRAAIDRTVKLYEERNPREGKGLASRLGAPVEESAIAWAMGDEDPSQLRQSLAGLNRGLGFIPAAAASTVTDAIANAGIGAYNLVTGESIPMRELGDAYLETADKRKLGNAEAQVFDRFDKRSTWGKTKDAGKAILSNPGAVATSLGEMLLDPSEMGVEALTTGATFGLGKVGAIKRFGDRLSKVAAGAEEAEKAGRAVAPLKARLAARAGLAAPVVGEVAVGSALQPALERGTVTGEDMAMGAVTSGALHSLFPAARLIDRVSGNKAKREAKAAAKKAAREAQPLKPIADDAGDFDVEDLRPTTGSQPGAAPAVGADALVGFRRAVGAGATRDPETGAIVYGPDAISALRTAIVEGRNNPKDEVKRAKGLAAEEIVNSSAQANPENWAPQLEHATLMGERYALGGGTQTFAHTPADALADMEPPKAAPSKKPLTPLQQARVQDALDQYIKKDEVLDEMDPKIIKRRAAENKFLADRGLLPEDAHQSFSRVPDRDAEINRVSDLQKAKRKEEIVVEESATQQAADYDAFAAGEALVRLQLSRPGGVGLLDKAGVKALSDALDADKRLQGGFRDQLVDLFGEERVKMFEDASLAPSNRHEWQKGALTGENPLEAIQRKRAEEVESAKAKAETEEQTAQANAEKQAKKDQEKKDQEKYKEDAKAHDDAEKKRFANEQKQNLFRDDVDALARMQEVTRIDPKTKKTLPSNKKKKELEGDAAKRSVLGGKLAKYLSESEALEALVSEALPSQFRAEFDNLMGSIRNMDGKNKTAMEKLGTWLSMHSTSLENKIPQVNVQRPRAFPKKAQPSQE